MKNGGTILQISKVGINFLGNNSQGLPSRKPILNLSEKQFNRVFPNE